MDVDTLLLAIFFGMGGVVLQRPGDGGWYLWSLRDVSALRLVPVFIRHVDQFVRVTLVIDPGGRALEDDRAFLLDLKQ